MRTRIDHKFVDVIPEELEEGVVYVCLQYETVTHKCCCGCGNEVVNPLHPLQWSVTFNGDTISLSPSIGNWSFPCRSHYWIRVGEVRWARTFDTDEIAALRARERGLMHRHFGSTTKPSDEPETRRARWWTKALGWIKRAGR